MSKKQKNTTTNAIRMIAAEKLPYELVEYEAEGGVGDNFGEHIAELIGVNKEQSFKTLVLKGDKNGIMVASIPCNHELDLKKLAKAACEKKVEMVHVKDLLGLTGYIRGSVSPIGMKKKYPTFLSETALNYEKIMISAGACGTAVKMKPNDIQKITGCIFADIIK